MRVQDLIKKLKTFPSDSIVVVNGPDGDGYDAANKLEEIEVVENESKGDWFGEYEDIWTPWYDEYKLTKKDKLQIKKENKSKIKVIYLHS